MSATLDELMKFSKSNGVRETSLLDLDALLKEVKSDLAADLQRSQTIINSDFLGKAMGAQLVVSQVLTNLISNAIAYRVPERINSVLISRHDEHGVTTLCVADTGIGLDNSHLQTAFEPFKRHSLEGNGSGLGLAICRRLLRSTGGDITYRGEPGVGTTFFIGLTGQPAVVETMIPRPTHKASRAEISPAQRLQPYDQAFR